MFFRIGPATPGSASKLSRSLSPRTNLAQVDLMMSQCYRARRAENRSVRNGGVDDSFAEANRVNCEPKIVPDSCKNQSVAGACFFNADVSWVSTQPIDKCEKTKEKCHRNMRMMSMASGQILHKCV